jgi:ureidoacrylate peracid hydrolase
MFRDYHCLLLEDCTAEPIANDSPRTNHEASLLTIQLLFGWVSNSEQFVKAVTGQNRQRPENQAFDFNH